jgi:hypothetical protein
LLAASQASTVEAEGCAVATVDNVREFLEAHVTRSVNFPNVLQHAPEPHRIPLGSAEHGRADLTQPRRKTSTSRTC